MPGGFWSYVHDDDTADGGRVVQLAHDIVAQYQMITGEAIALFLDRDDLEWGNSWQQRIDESLADVAFFIPVLTPRYFASGACRSELTTFARRASALGVRELVLPLLYTTVDGLDDPDSADDLVVLVRQFQWVDWRELRWAEPSSEAYRRGVFGLAERLVAANRFAENVDVTATPVGRAVAEDDEPDMFERLAAFETQLPNLTATTEGLAESINDVNQIVTLSGADIQAAGNQTFARRLLVLRELASELRPPADRIRELGEDFARQLHDVDQGIRVAIERAQAEPENRAQYCSFFESVRAMVASAEEGLGALDGMIAAMLPLERMSRDMRAPLRDMRAGLTLFSEGRDVMRPWISLIDATGIDCSAP